jgi:transcriptional regulator with GAF, ATPase, and Fis domain
MCELRTEGPAAETVRRPPELPGLVGSSSAMGRVYSTIEKVSRYKTNILLLGESGTGKELIARALHARGPRRQQLFVPLNCATLGRELLENELFGHERGAFTGADRQKRGLLESADGGTVFLDEIGEMAPQLQAKLLRFLEEKAFKRVGGVADIRVDVRVIAATNRNLEDEVKKGRFREDLYYRLNVLPIVLPPLRTRADDIPELVHYFVDSYNREFRKRVRGVAPDAMRRLQAYGWPGNIRELRNAVERAMLLVEGDELSVDQFPVASAAAPRLTEGVDLPVSGIDLEQLERSLVVQSLERSGWNQTRAAALLGLNRDQIRYRIEKFKLEKPAAT